MHSNNNIKAPLSTKSRYNILFCAFNKIEHTAFHFHSIKKLFLTKSWEAENNKNNLYISNNYFLLVSCDLAHQKI